MFRKLFYFFRIPITVFLFNIIISFFGIYDLYPAIDIPMHFLGGAAIAYSFILIFNYWQTIGKFRINNKLVKLFLLLAVVVFVAVFWEFWEFGMDYFFAWDAQGGLNDTMLDLFLGLCGGLGVGLINLNRRKIYK